MTTTPNKENLRKWVAALRSGEYQQGSRVLTFIHNDGTEAHCCLGVACQVAMKNGVKVPVERGPQSLSTGTLNIITYDEEPYYLPILVQEFFGLDKRRPYIEPNLRADEANDDLGWDFNQIADAVETYYKLNEEDTDVGTE